MVSPYHGTLEVRVRDELGTPIPARLTFLGMAGTKTPAFTSADVGLDQPGGVMAYNRAFIVDEATLAVPPGRYEVWASHGIEYEAVPKIIDIATGRTTVLGVVLAHTVATPGWISGDFHVHAERSFDSHVAMTHRALQFAADGVDLLVSTDHNVIADYTPVIAKLGLGAELATLRGDELTTADWGHFGAFPLAGTPDLPDGGAPITAGRTPEQLFADLRAHDPDAVIDIHHPRLEDGHIGYFHLGKLDTARLVGTRPGFSFDFDAIEVLNGYQDPDRHSLDVVLADWFAFLRHGHRVTATGNSDTHHLTFNLGGFPRNYVALASATPGSVDGRALARAVKAGRAYFTTGPIVAVTVGDATLGDTITTHGEPLLLHVVVRAATWIAVDRVTIIVDGVVTSVWPAARGPIVRFDQTIPVPVAKDGFVVVRVDGDRAMAPVIGDAQHFRVYPLAITNPIWVHREAAR